ncbi:MAG: hypothetical protein NZM04_02700 [Methylacidiphilales bacterium]|nr:hypothetical protein [Candidatus Methylacidiphilales bacterium]
MAGDTVWSYSLFGVVIVELMWGVMRRIWRMMDKGMILGWAELFGWFYGRGGSVFGRIDGKNKCACVNVGGLGNLIDGWCEECGYSFKNFLLGGALM